jgi:hypothetical protein
MMNPKQANFEQALVKLMEEHDVTLMINCTKINGTELLDGFEHGIALRFVECLEEMEVTDARQGS